MVLSQSLGDLWPNKTLIKEEWGLHWAADSAFLSRGCTVLSTVMNKLVSLMRKKRLALFLTGTYSIFLSCKERLFTRRESRDH